MNLAEAQSVITAALARINALYQQTLFDEWVLVKLATEQGAILAYEGPRSDSYQKRFKTDIGPLREQLIQRKMADGDFEFVPTAKGTYFDACIRLGPAAYLFCNNTTRSMTEIRKNPLWLAAQKPFLDLATKFRADPLE